MSTFSTLNLSIPDSILKLSPEQQHLVFSYLEQLNDFDRKAYTIAKNHLGTSFDILRSNGYLNWLKTQPSTKL
jgi:hypothetical protein